MLIFKKIKSKKVYLVFDDENLVFPEYFLIANKNTSVNIFDSSLNISLSSGSFCVINEHSSLIISNFTMELTYTAKIDQPSFWTILSSNTSIQNLQFKLFLP